MELHATDRGRDSRVGPDFQFPGIFRVRRGGGRADFDLNNIKRDSITTDVYIPFPVSFRNYFLRIAVYVHTGQTGFM